MRRHVVLITFRALAAATLLAACGSEPKLDVQTASNEPRAAAATNVPVQPAHAQQPIPGQAGELPPGHVPLDTLPAGHPPLDANSAPGAGGAMSGAPMSLVPVDPNAGQGATGMSWTAPAGWLAQPPSSSMRRAQYKVSGPGGDGECVVFYFGPGQGGGPMENAQRWAGQFAQPDGKNPLEVMKTNVSEASGAPVLFVETTGTYSPGTMMGGPSDPKAGWALFGAIVQGADANWFFKFTGPKTTVDAQRDAFQSLVASVKRGG